MIRKQNKVSYYLNGYLRCIVPCGSAEDKIRSLSKSLTKQQLDDVYQRVEYYNRINAKTPIGCDGTRVCDLRFPSSPKVYFFDTYKFARYFPKDLRINYVFGDVSWNVDAPSIVKTRPIEGSTNSVLLNLNSVRHFVFVEDSTPYTCKRDIVFGRTSVYQKHRIDFFNKYFNHPMYDLGQVNKNGGNSLWLKPKIPIQEHLNYKFILSLQGNDVATNLKWIMSSNSIAVSTAPTIETWFMEGTLVGGEHFIEIDSSYSNLQSQLEYYLSHPKEAAQIIENANLHCARFFNPDVEKLTSLLVLKKYFDILKQQI